MIGTLVVTITSYEMLRASVVTGLAVMGRHHSFVDNVDDWVGKVFQ